MSTRWFTDGLDCGYISSIEGNANIDTPPLFLYNTAIIGVWFALMRIIRFPLWIMGERG